jgi:nicotinamidase-related amidase
LKRCETYQEFEMPTSAVPTGAQRQPSPTSRLGRGAYPWKVNADYVDLAAEPALVVRMDIKAEPRNITMDANRSAFIVVDMQNDFCAPGGWVDHLGVDLSPERAPIAPLQRLLPALRARKIPIVWLNWGNRPDQMNLRPTVLYVFNNDGDGLGIGGTLPNSGAKVLEKDSWSAAVVDELKQLPGDIHVDKYRISGFWDTPLDSILRNLGVTTLMFGGVNTDQCVMHTLTDAHFLGYNCVLVDDCCGTTSPDYCVQATIWNVKTCFGFVTSSDEVIKATSTG